MMEIHEAMKMVESPPSGDSEIRKFIVEFLAGDPQKMGLGLGAIMAIESALTILRTVGIEMEVRRKVDEITQLPKEESIVNRMIGRRHK